jgi:hypothetical protein
VVCPLQNPFDVPLSINEGDAMMSSLPCPVCGQVDDLETVNPLGIHVDKAVLWNCRCGNTRAVAISHHIPQELVKKAMVRDEMSDWSNRYLGCGKAG